MEELFKEIVHNKAGKRISMYFFKNFSTLSDASKNLYPDYFVGQKAKKLGYKRKIVGIVHRYFKNWEKRGWIEESVNLKNIKSKKGKIFERRVKTYRLNLNYFFDYCKMVKKIEFTKEEKDFLSDLIYPIQIRELCLQYGENVIDGVINFLLKRFILSQINFYALLRLLELKCTNKKFSKLVKRYKPPKKYKFELLPINLHISTYRRLAEEQGFLTSLHFKIFAIANVFLEPSKLSKIP